MTLREARAAFQAIDAEMREAVIDGRRFARWGEWRQAKSAMRLEETRSRRLPPVETIVDARLTG